MIALKLVFQSLAGVGAVFGCLGGGYYVINNEADSFYLVTSKTASTTQPTLDLWTAKTEDSENKKTQKNYKCQSGETEKLINDETCVLYTLYFPTAVTPIKTSDIQTFIKDTTKTTNLITKTEAKTEIKANKFFLLKANKKLHTTWTFDEKNTIKLRDKSTEALSTSNTYATFQAHAKISSTTIEGKSSFAIVSYESDESSAITEGSSLKCKFKGAEDSTQKPCVVTEISETASNKTLETLVFTSITLPTTQKAITSITKDKHYLIQYLAPEKHLISDLKEQKIIVVETPAVSVTTKKEGEFKVKTPAFINPITTTEIKEVIILK